MEVEPSSEDSDNLIDDILSALQQNSSIRTDRVAQEHTSVTSYGFEHGYEQSFDILIDEAEVVLEDGLNVHDIVDKEIIINNDSVIEARGSEYMPSDMEEQENDFYNIPNNDEGQEDVSVTENLQMDEENIDEPKYVAVLEDGLNVHDIVDKEIIINNDSVIETTGSECVPSNMEEQENDFYNIPNNDERQEDVSVTENLQMDEENTDEQNVAVAPNLCALEVVEDDNLTGRKRQKRPNKSEWDVLKNKNLRMTGKEYIGYKKVKVDGKIVVKRSDGHRAERKMGPLCASNICRANKKRNCTEINQEQRCLIFKEFWTLSWSEKKVYIRAHVKKTKKKQVTVQGNNQSRRSDTLKYYLSANNELKPVCKVMFLNTLGVKEWMIQNWVKNMNEEEIAADEENELLAEDNAVQLEQNSKKNNTRERNSSVKQQIIAEWLENLPKVPAHYCRASSSKLYLEPLWHSKKELYDTYKQYCNENGKLWGSLTLFMQVFESKNISIYIPKKDQCDTCYSFKAGNLSKEDHDKHLKEKESARKEKESDKKLALDGKVYCLTCDVQSVKLAPSTKASAMYYKTKLCCHNYTVYNLETRHCRCYWFTEVEGDLSANSFASCLVDYLTDNCLNHKRPIIIYSDGCTNQNRNQYVSNALLHFSVQNQVEVTQKYLIKGHTQMEGDSVHARIEKTIKGKDVYVPYEYVRYTTQARTNPSPYEAKYLKYDFFKNYESISYYDSIRPGKRKGDPVVTDVHYLHYLPKGEILYKLTFEDLPKILPRRPKHVDRNAVPTQLFKEQVKISLKKWNHLQDLKTVIPSDYHEFYDKLPHHI